MSAIPALILAAGASSRMGSPKALLPLDGETFVDRLIGIYSIHCRPIVVVLGHDAEIILAGIRRASDATFVRNPDPGRGQLTSLQCGLAALPPDIPGVLFTPVDYPAVRPSTIEQLAVNLPGNLLVIPCYQGRHGHPVAIAQELIPEFLALPETARASDVIHRHAGQTRYLEVADPGVITDIDTPEAYQQLLADQRRQS